MDTTEDSKDPRMDGQGSLESRPALVLVWCAEDPSRVGEVALPAATPGELLILGRGDRPPPSGTRLGLVRQRPGIDYPRGPLEATSVSREQLGLRWDGQVLHGERLGSAAMEKNGEPFERGPLEHGDLLSVGRSWLWLVEARPLTLPALRVEVPSFPFGRPDAWGLVGESPAIWALRERVATVGPLAMHVFLHGPSGAGKELVARALHMASTRRSRPFISRNAATLPPGLVDAELFGNVRGYPNPTMAERAGLIGAADGGTLFLDELGELPHEVQAHLLRVLDEGGEYQRLGEAQTRRSDFRLVGATNRPASALKHDLLQRFRLRVEVPGLELRPSDIPLILLHLVEVLRERSPSLYRRGVVTQGGRERLDIDLGFLAQLIRRRQWVGHVRELDAELWQAFLDAVDGPIGRGRRELESAAQREDDMATGYARVSYPVSARVQSDPGDVTSAEPRQPNEDPGPEAIEAALDRNGGNISAAARELGLSSRYALYRLMQRHGLAGRRGP
jgi:two-component system nitrogen regulation response regulator GlnG/two-component system response regulator HydG